MKTNLMKDIFGLAFTKKSFLEKLIYLFKGIIFLPILISENRPRREKNNNTSDVSVAGDDVYPLF